MNNLCKKLLSIMLIATIILGVLPIKGFASGTQSVFIGGNNGAGIQLDGSKPYWKNGDKVATTNETDYNAYFDSATSTLTLRNATINEYYSRPTYGNYAGIYVNGGGLNVILIGTNTIDISSYTCSNTCYGLWLDVDDNLTFDSRSTGTLVSKGGNSPNDGRGSWGINAGGAITINGGTITAIAGKAFNFAAGIQAWRGIVINGGELTAISEDGGNVSTGVYAETTMNAGVIIAKGSKSVFLYSPTINGIPTYVASVNINGSNPVEYNVNNFKTYKYLKVSVVDKAPPKATTDPATQIDTTSATLNGKVSAGNSDTNVKFEYGITNGYGNTVDITGTITGTVEKSFSKEITGLSPNTTYYYRIVASNSEGTTYGVGSSFKTLNMPTIGEVSEQPEMKVATNLNNTLVKPTVSENGLTIASSGWEISADGSTNWSLINANSLCSVNQNGYYVRYFVKYWRSGTQYTAYSPNNAKLTINRYVPTITLSVIPASSQFIGTKVKLTAVISDGYTSWLQNQNNLNSVPIKFKDGENVLGNEIIDASTKIAVFEINGLSEGNYNFIAEFPGDVNYNKDVVSNAIAYSIIVNPDIETINQAKDKVNQIEYGDIGKETNLEARIKEKIEEKIETSLGDGSIQVTINKISYTAPNDGTFSNQMGVNGKYVFTITLSKGEVTQTTEHKTITIIAKNYSEILAAAKTEAKVELLAKFSTHTESYYSPANWTVLNNAKSTGDTTIENATDIAGVTKAKNEAIEAMKAVKTLAQEEADAAAALAATKTEAKAELLAKLGTYTESDYSSANWTALNNAKSDGDTTIGKATDIAGVTAVKEAALAAMAAIKTKTQEAEEALVVAKTVAKDALVTALGNYKQTDYSAENWTALNNAKSDGDTTIGKATDIAGVKAVKEAALAAMAVIKTKTQEAEEALVVAKTVAKDALVTALGNYKQTDYSAENWTALNNAKSDGDTAIDKATDIAGVTAVKEAALAAMAAIKTKTQEAAEEAAKLLATKTEAKEALATELEEYKESDYSPENWIAVNKAKTNGDTAIDKATDIAGATAAKEAALAAMAAVETLAQEEADADEALAAAKTTAKADLETALSRYTSSNYSESNWTELNNARTAGDIAIDAAADLGGVIAAKNAALAAMDAVMTIDTTPPSITSGDVRRTSDTTATVKFTSDEGGTYYYKIGSAPDTSKVGTALSTSETTINLTGLTAAETYIYIVAKDAAGNSSLTDFRITIPAYVVATYQVGGTVNDSSGALSGAEVKLMAGQSQIGSTATTDEYGNFTITDVPNGTYNLVVSKGGIIVTSIITVSNANYAAGTITLPAGKTNSMVVVEGSETPKIVVGNLDKQFARTVKHDDKGITESDIAVVTSGGAILIKFVAEKKDNTASNANNIISTSVTNNKIVGIFLDLSVLKTVTSGSAVTSTTLSGLNDLIDVLIPLDETMQNKTDYIVYRYHAGSVQSITTTANEDGEKFELIDNNTTIKLKVKKFSTYAIAYAPETGTTTNPTSSRPSLPTINVEQTKGGEVVISTDRKTVTITPYNGYVIGYVKVDGKSVGTVEQYTFKDCKDHTIAVNFVKETAIPYYLQDGEKIYISFSVISGSIYKYIAPEGVTVEYGENPKNFIDNTIQWAKPSIDFVTERELFLSTSQDIFSPNTSMTRAMFVTVLGRLYERTYGMVTGTSTFDDIDLNAYYAKYVQWAKENRLIKGIGNNKFAPDENVTREQMAVIMLNFAKLLNKADKAEKPLTYIDSASISAWAIDGAIYCQETNIIKGRDGGNFAPLESATRAEVAAVVERLIKTIMK